MDTVTLTREELYERVWAEPMMVIAASFGISGVALGKRCRRAGIPVPGRGYWAKKAAGKRVRQVHLPAAKTAFELRPIRIVSYPVVEAVPEPEPVAGPVYDQELFEARPENRIDVRDRLSRHPCIRATAASARSDHGPATSFVGAYGDGTLGLSVSRQSLLRALRLLDAFVRGCESRGWPVSGAGRDQQTGHVKVLGQQIEFRLREPQRRIDRVKEERLRIKPGEYMYGRYRYEPTGIFEFNLGGRYGAGACYLRDTKELRLEDCLNDLMVALVEAAVAMNERDERLRLEQIERERQASLRCEERRQDEREKQRQEQLFAGSDGWRRAQNLREFLVEIEKTLRTRETAARLPADTEAWLAWGYYVADEMDPLLLADPVEYLER